MPITNIKCEICNTIDDCKFIQINNTYTIRCKKCSNTNIKKNIELIIEMPNDSAFDIEKKSSFLDKNSLSIDINEIELTCKKNKDLNENISIVNDIELTCKNNSLSESENISLVNDNKICYPLSKVFKKCIDFFKKCIYSIHNTSSKKKTDV